MTRESSRPTPVTARTAAASAGDVVEHGEGDEVVGPAGVVLAALADPDQDAVTRGQAELADLDVGAVMVQGHFTANGDARLVGAQVKAARRQG